MNASKMQTITVITQASLEHTLCQKLRIWGAPSYSVEESINTAPASATGGKTPQKHIRIDITAAEDAARAILDALQREKFDCGWIAYFSSDTTATQRGTNIQKDSDFSQKSREQTWGDYLITI